MENRSAAFDRVCEAAVTHFAVTGYDGASLNEIALLVGIKKASLYSHVASKEVLYTQVLQDAVEIESAYVTQVLTGKAPANGPGAAYVESIASRYAESVHLRFLLRAAFLPPVHLKSAVGLAYERFLSVLGHGFQQQLETCAAQAKVATPAAERYRAAYVGIVESLFVELIYADADKMAHRADALWQVLGDSLRLHGLPIAQ